MKKLDILSFMLLVFLTPSTAFGWGAKGHNVIAHIAQNHLSPRAGREVTRLLGGYNMAYWSAWADGLRDDPRYDTFSTWHYANADEGFTYATAPKNPEGDVFTAVSHCVEQLSARTTGDTLKSMYLKLLIHFVGDMHCPMHAGRAGDRGGNEVPVTFLGTPGNLHRMWDSQLIDAARPWSALEWALNIDRRMTRDQRRALISGVPGGHPARTPDEAMWLEWMEQTVATAHTLYADTPDKVSWPYINRYTPLAERKLLEAGHRLAWLLNKIFD
jgi:hypothetical protein